MGRIANVVPVKDIVEQSIQSYVTDATSVYSNFLETAPTFVTYYSRAAFKSTYDESFQAYNEIAGSESPNKFNKIEDLPIYSLDISDFSTEMGDQGWSSEVSSSAIILPDTVTPKTDDLIEISFHTKKYLFVVTSGTPDNFGNNKFYKINIRLSQYTTNEINRQVDDEFKVDYDLIGKKANTVIKKSYAESLVNLRSKYDELLGSYIDQYYILDAQCFANTNNVLDQNINYFLTKNDLLKPFVNYRNSCFISPTISKYIDKAAYQKSFLKNIEDLDFSKIHNKESIFVIPNNIGKNRYEFINLLKNKYTFVEYIDQTKYIAGAIADIIDLKFYSNTTLVLEDVNLQFALNFSKFFANLDDIGTLSNGVKIDEKLTLTGKEFFEKMLKDITNLNARYNTFTEKHNNFINDYYLTPIILFALKHLFYLISKT